MQEVYGIMRTGYRSDASDEEWGFASFYLMLMKEDAPQGRHSLREVFKGLRGVVRTGANGADSGIKVIGPMGDSMKPSLR